MEEISQAELAERVAILRKFRSLLEQQRKKFQEYLAVLEKQEHSIEEEDTEALVAHAELEQAIAGSLSNLQKVIVPFSEMYKSAASSLDRHGDVAAIQADLNRLQAKVLAQNEKNREKIRAHLVQIRRQLDEFKNEQALNNELSKSGAKNPEILKPLIDLTSVSFENGEIRGLDEQIARAEPSLCVLDLGLCGHNRVDSRLACCKSSGCSAHTAL